MGFKLWERYVFAELVRLWLLLLAGIYVLYIVIDYSSHAEGFTRSGASLWQLIRYYTAQFSTRWEFLAPFALLVATIRVLCRLNTNNELIALFSGGVTRKRLLLPMWIVAVVCAGSILLNFEFLRPDAILTVERIEALTFKNHGVRLDTPKVRGFVRQDGSTVIFQAFDPIQMRFFDLFWLVSGDEVYRAKEVQLEESQSVGFFVDHLKRSESGAFEVLGQHGELIFPQLAFDDETLQRSLHTPKYWSLSTLWELRPKTKVAQNFSERDSLILTAFHEKLAFPWLAVLVVLGPAPWCLRFTRRLPVFAIFGAAVVGFILFLTMFSAARVLGETQLLHPAVAVWSPVLLALGLLCLPFHRMR